jgi:hypothetical protein
VLEIKDVKSSGCNRFFKGAEGVLQNVSGHCEREMVKFAMQRVMQENQFGRRQEGLQGYRLGLWLGSILHEDCDVL